MHNVKHQGGFVKRLIFSLLAIYFLAFQSQAQESSLATSTDNISGNSKWGTSYFGFSGVDVQAVNQGSPAAYHYNYISLNYKLSAKEKINFRPAFVFNTAGFRGNGETQESDVIVHDFYINYKKKDLALLPGDWAVLGEARLYLPTSESAQEKKTITRLQGKMISEKLLGNRWIAQYTNESSYFIQSQKAYRYEKNYPDGGKKIEARANTIAEIDHYMSVGRYLNKVFTPKMDVGFIHEYLHTSPQVTGGSASRNQLKLAPNTEIHVTRDTWFILGVESAVDLNNTRITSRWQDDRGQSINLFHPENTQYYLMTFISL